MLPIDNPPSLRHSVDELLKEIANLREENESLRRSAYYWIYLYEGALHRANRLESQVLQVSAN